MIIAADNAWACEKLTTDQPDEVLKFVIWLLWETKPEDIPTNEAALHFKAVLEARPDAAAEAIQKARAEIDEFVNPPKRPR